MAKPQDLTCITSQEYWHLIKKGKIDADDWQSAFLPRNKANPTKDERRALKKDRHYLPMVSVAYAKGHMPEKSWAEIQEFAANLKQKLAAREDSYESRRR
jgi:hypothetical protein